MQTFGLRHLLNKQAPEDRMDTLRVWRIALAVTLGIGLLKHLPLAAGLAGLAAAATQLYLPLRYALTAPGGDDGIGYNFDGITRDLPVILVILLLTCIPFWFAHEWWWTWQGLADGSGSKLLLPASDLADWLRQRGVRWEHSFAELGTPRTRRNPPSGRGLARGTFLSRFFTTTPLQKL